MTTTANQSDFLYEACLRESETRLAYKRAKATVRLECVGKQGVTKAWQMVAVDPRVMKLEDEWEDAKIELEIQRFVVRGYGYASVSEGFGSGDDDE